MRLSLLILAACLVYTTPALADVVAFPPTRPACTTGMNLMSYDGVNDTGCRTDLDVVTSVVPDCSNGQVLAKYAGVFTCVTPKACTQTIVTTYSKCAGNLTGQIVHNTTTDCDGKTTTQDIDQCACTKPTVTTTSLTCPTGLSGHIVRTTTTACNGQVTTNDVNQCSCSPTYDYAYQACPSGQQGSFYHVTKTACDGTVTQYDQNNCYAYGSVMQQTTCTVGQTMYGGYVNGTFVAGAPPGTDTYVCQ